MVPPVFSGVTAGVRATLGLVGLTSNIHLLKPGQILSNTTEWSNLLVKLKLFSNWIFQYNIYYVVGPGQDH